MRIAVIPARGGSKRIPRKNIRDFCGKPIISWSIDAAKNSGCFDLILVSTDDCEIAEISKAHGAQVPFIRPSCLSDDFTETIPVVRHAIEWLLSTGKCVERVCCIYATAPFITGDAIRSGLTALENSNSDYAFSVTSFAFPIQRAIYLTEDGGVEMVQPEHLKTRSQDLKEAYHDAGQFYWGRTNAWLGNKPVLGKHSMPVLLPRYRVQDIDTLEDWERAEWMFKAMRAQENS